MMTTNAVAVVVAVVVIVVSSSSEFSYIRLDHASLTRSLFVQELKLSGVQKSVTTKSNSSSSQYVPLPTATPMLLPLS